MPSGRERRIAREKRAEFRDKQKYNRIKAKLDQEYRAMRNQGMTPDQIFASQAQTYAPGTSVSPTTTSGVTPGTTAAANTINGPAGRGGFQGQGSPKTGPAGAPAWWNNSNPFANVTGSTGATPSGPPAWLSSVVNRRNAANLTAGLGLASQAVPFFGGTLTPFFSSLTNALNNQSRNTPASQPGTVQNRTVNPMTGIPDFPMLTQTGPQFFGSGGWYNNYRKRGRGGGRRSAPRQQAQGYIAGNGYDNAPAWTRGLANWSIG